MVALLFSFQGSGVKTQAMEVEWGERKTIFMTYRLFGLRGGVNLCAVLKSQKKIKAGPWGEPRAGIGCGKAIDRVS